MITYCQYLKDMFGQNFIGVKFYPTQVEPYLEKLKTILKDDYDSYIKNQLQRDNGEHYIKVISTFEYDRLCQSEGLDNFINSLETVFDYEVNDIKCLGLGKAERDGNKSYYILVNSTKLEEIRNKYDLPKVDFHVTLGFKWKDVEGVRKNQILSEKTNFIKLLSEEFYKHHETFEFIKNIDNFNGDSELEVESIKINETSATFRLGRNLYFTVTLVDEKFRISAEWFGKSDLPILSTTVVKKKFKEL